VAEPLPLFPLGHTVLFPGVVLPLHVFEERYRELVRTLVELPEGARRRFGVVAIRQGWEVGEDAVSALHDVGCAAELRRVSRYPDGRYDIVTVGTDRFRLRSIDRESRPYLVGSVEWLPAEPPLGLAEPPAGPLAEPPAVPPRPAGPGPAGQPGPAGVAGLADAVATLFAEYVDAVAGLQGRPSEETELPDDPVQLAYAVAAAAVLTLEDRQALLEADTTRARLRAELRLLKRETTMVRRLLALPVPIGELQVSQSLS
jgi:Lon protease-like protein